MIHDLQNFMEHLDTIFGVPTHDKGIFFLEKVIREFKCTKLNATEIDHLEGLITNYWAEKHNQILNCNLEFRRSYRIIFSVPVLGNLLVF